MPKLKKHKLFDDPEEIAYYHALYPAEKITRLGERFGLTRQTVASIIKRTPIDASRVAEYRKLYYDKLGDKLASVGVMRQRTIVEGEEELARLIHYRRYGSARELSSIITQTQERDALAKGQPTSITAHFDALPVAVIKRLVIEGEAVERLRKKEPVEPVMIQPTYGGESPDEGEASQPDSGGGGGNA